MLFVVFELGTWVGQTYDAYVCGLQKDGCTIMQCESRK